MKFVSCMCWVERGQASLEPQKVRLSKEELEGLIKEELPAESSEEDEAAGEDGEEPAVKTEKKGLRGSAPKEEPSDTDGTDNEDSNKRKRKAENPEDRYTLETYEEEGSQIAAKMTGIACFASSEEDPYITEKGEDLDPDEAEDFLLKSDDNQLVVARVRDDQISLEVFVYNAGSDDFYIHHDYPLENPPLCLAHISREAGEDGEKGNFCAIGTMSPCIELFDLDVVDTMDPAMRLGTEKKLKPSAKKRKKEELEHSEAVLSLAWNRSMDHILASGSADNTIILWDLDSGEGSNQLKGHEEKVQALAWHPQEPAILLSGACDGTVNLWDCNGLEVKQSWTLENEEVEHILWDRDNPFYFMVATSEGSISYYDSRSEKVVFSHAKAHEGEITTLRLHPTNPQCVLSSGEDGVLKIWKKEVSGLKLIDVKTMSMGQIRSAEFCPDSPMTLAVGSTKSDYLRLWSLSSSEKAKTEFGF